jgi:hypothetical protein
MTHYLEAITDPQNRNAQLKYLCRDLGRVGSVNALWPTREDYGLGFLALNLGQGQIEREYLGIYTQFSDFSGDQLCVLGAKIEDQNLIHASILTIAKTNEKGEILYWDQAFIIFIIS